MTLTKKVVNPGKIEGHNVYVAIKTEQKEKGLCLSISGVIGPRINGNAWGGRGQILDSLNEIDSYTDGWGPEEIQTLYNIWKHWHLNDMNASCFHQKGPEWDPSRLISFVGFQDTNKTKALRDSAIAGPLTDDDYCIIKQCEAYHGESFNTEMIPERISELVKLGYMEPWHLDYLEKTEQAGWVEVRKGGLLSKPCEVCGYKYGTAWLFREVPSYILSWLSALPDTNIPPAWV